MIKKVWIINGILALLTVIVGLNMYDIWSGGDDGAGSVEPVSPPPLPRVEDFRKPQAKPENTYRAIVEDNLFSPDRKEVIVPPPSPAVAPTPEPEPEPEPEAPAKPLEKVEGKKILLYGVISMPDYRAAIVTNVDEKAPQRPQKTVRIGETIGEYTIAEIKKERVLLTKGRERYEITLFDREHPKERATATKERIQPEAAAPKVITAQPVAPKTETAAKAPKGKEEDEWEIVSTPFGKVKRRKR